jgi:DNA-binding CsgD family transcriptional regulator
VAALGLLDLALGRPQLAMDRLERLLETTAHPMIRLSVVTDLVEAAARADHLDRVTRVVTLVDRWAGSSDSKGARAVADRCRALAADPDEAVALFERSLASQQGGGESTGLARTHLLLGEHLRRARRRSEARPHLRAAWDIFDRLGATPWAERARTELRATGETARSRTSADHEALTPQERHIAALVAQGASSKQVAAQLFLSPRTVDYHLRKVFMKTGISSRTELRTLDLE